MTRAKRTAAAHGTMLLLALAALAEPAGSVVDAHQACPRGPAADDAGELPSCSEHDTGDDADAGETVALCPCNNSPAPTCDPGDDSTPSGSTLGCRHLLHEQPATCVTLLLGAGFLLSRARARRRRGDRDSGRPAP